MGIDIVKNAFQVHGIDAAEKVVLKKQLRRGQVLEFLGKLPPCLTDMEACATSYHWARELRRLGHDVRLMPPSYVKADIKRCELGRKFQHEELVDPAGGGGCAHLDLPVPEWRRARAGGAVQ